MKRARTYTKKEAADYYRRQTTFDPMLPTGVVSKLYGRQVLRAGFLYRGMWGLLRGWYIISSRGRRASESLVRNLWLVAREARKRRIHFTFDDFVRLGQNNSLRLDLSNGNYPAPFLAFGGSCDRIGNLKIGCQTFTFVELDRLAKKRGWARKGWKTPPIPKRRKRAKKR